MALMKKYKQPSYEKANKEANQRYRDKLSAAKKPEAKYTPIDTSIGPNLTSKSNRQYGSVDRNVQDYQGAKAPDYKNKSSADSYANNPVVQDYANNLSQSKETATGTLSAKSEPSEDRMSWAREAEKKARKMMGGN